MSTASQGRRRASDGSENGRSDIGTYVVCYVVDCGKRDSRIIEYSMKGTQLTSRMLKSGLTSLVIILQDSKAWQPFLESIERVLPSGDNEAHILIAATGGVREAFASEGVDLKALMGFERNVSSFFDGRAVFQRLSGFEEAIYEWTATIEAVRARGTSIPEQSLAPECCAGMLSGGGATSQLAVAEHKHGYVEGYSFNCCIKSPNGLGGLTSRIEKNDDEIEQGLYNFCKELEGHINGLGQKLQHARGHDDGAFHGLRGIFMLIEWPSAFITSTGCDGLDFPYWQFIGHDAILSKLKELAASQRSRRDHSKDAIEARAYCVLLIALMEKIFSEDSTFICADRKGAFVPNWMSGYVLQRRRIEEFKSLQSGPLLSRNLKIEMNPSVLIDGYKHLRNERYVATRWLVSSIDGKTYRKRVPDAQGTE